MSRSNWATMKGQLGAGPKHVGVKTSLSRGALTPVRSDHDGRNLTLVKSQLQRQNPPLGQVQGSMAQTATNSVSAGLRIGAADPKTADDNLAAATAKSDTNHTPLPPSTLEASSSKSNTGDAVVKELSDETASPLASGLRKPLRLKRPRAADPSEESTQDGATNLDLDVAERKRLKREKRLARQANQQRAAADHDMTDPPAGGAGEQSNATHSKDRHGTQNAGSSDGFKKGKSHQRARHNQAAPAKPGALHLNPAQMDADAIHKQGIKDGSLRPRKYTVSIAVPGSVVDNAQNRELKTNLVGQIARAAAIYHVDEIVVYDDSMATQRGQGVRDESQPVAPGRCDPNVFMARLLQYVETPQYLRKRLFPMHPDLKFAGLLNPLDAPHHVRADERSIFREGVVVAEAGKKGGGCLVDIGTRREAKLDRKLEMGVRVTVKLHDTDPTRRSHTGKAVPPSTPREELGLYWGYSTRMAKDMSEVLAASPFQGGYDLTIGTSERGAITVDDKNFAIPSFKHMLIVFGGVQGIEASIDNDEQLQLPGSEAHTLFDMWLNVCPNQGSRTIRTEEAVLLTLARLRPHVLLSGQ